jgi:predicted nucleotidyltransferase
MSLREVLTPVLRVLETLHIPYAVIGGYAVAAWGQIRATRDIDLVCESSDLDRLKTALAEASLRFEHRRGDSEDPIGHVIRVEVPVNDGVEEIDIIAEIRDAPAGIVRRSRRVALEGLNLQIAAPEDMLLLKVLAGSPLDLEDARSILHANDLQMKDLQLNWPPRLLHILKNLADEVEGNQT